MRGAAWTRERVKLLKQLWAKGETAGAIGVRLGGLSRSAVLGKVFRLRLCIAGAGPGSAPQQTAAAKGKRRGARSQATADSSARPARLATKKDAPARRRRRGDREDSPAAPRSAAKRRGKTLLELTNDTCRWPHGRPGSEKFFFCGVAGADLERGMPYCPRHARRAYCIDTMIVVAPRRMASRAA